MKLFVAALAFLAVNSLDIKADIFAAPFHKLLFSSMDPPLDQDLIAVQVNNQDLKCHIQPPNESKNGELQAEEGPDNLLELALQEVSRMKCLQWDLGFWKYEFCPNSGISQFHQVPEKGVVLQYDLGKKLLKRELPTVNDTHTFAFASITLGSGTICDVTGEPRATEIQFHCKQNVNDHISKVSEVSTCKYLAVIYTSRICKVSPRFIPRTVLEERLITCYGSNTDGYIYSFFEEEVPQNEVEDVEQEGQNDSQDTLLSIAKKLLEQNGFSLEVLNLDQDE